MTTPDTPTARRGRPGEVLVAFAKLGVTSFGGPIAHLGFFRDEFVVRRRWLGEQAYADLVALCQFLPGPASSQVGFALGLLRAGPLGAVLAFLAFTLPSALLLIAFAAGAALIAGPVGAGLLAGLKIVAVAIVAHAVWGMARALCPDRPRASIAVVAAIVMLGVAAVLPAVAPFAAIVVGALGGWWLCRSDEVASGPVVFPVSRAVGVTALVLFGVLLVGLPVLAALGSSPALAIADAFYRAGALVFGGGHVVLPLLQTEVVDSGWVSTDAFLAGYGAAQAVPGPLFTFAAYLGWIIEPGPGAALGATIALAAIFLPGFLLLIGVLPFWNGFRARPVGRAVVRGANAAVVGVLGVALYDPLFTTAILGPAEFGLALVCFVLLVAWRVPPWVVVIVGALGGVVLGVTGLLG